MANLEEAARLRMQDVSAQSSRLSTGEGCCAEERFKKEEEAEIFKEINKRRRPRFKQEQAMDLNKHFRPTLRTFEASRWLMLVVLMQIYAASKAQETRGIVKGK